MQKVLAVVIDYDSAISAKLGIEALDFLLLILTLVHFTSKMKMKYSVSIENWSGQ